MRPSFLPILAMAMASAAFDIKEQECSEDTNKAKRDSRRSDDESIASFYREERLKKKRENFDKRNAKNCIPPNVKSTERAGDVIDGEGDIGKGGAP